MNSKEKESNFVLSKRQADGKVDNMLEPFTQPNKDDCLAENDSQSEFMMESEERSFQLHRLKRQKTES